MNSISEKIFEGEPKKVKSIQIEFSNDELENKETDFNKKIFDMLLEIFYDGMKKFHLKNGKVNLEEVSNDEFNKIKEYFWSTGFDVFYKLIKDNEVVFKNDYKEKKSELKDYYLNLKTDNFIYQIYFDYY
tara:strand:+ start:398 stop:787 length:390 start_codon:yes stop_codon:yes gene_type:complete